ncbi:hypothetical protein O181_063213 [Austropuccinia psidii MF-1]|uniref:Retrotransposon gag domain-containing protein n=1 Tax=Austropuccinia psidii MF-1 TaxID=1389203 RepID=A0A9Q3ER73_9BASI|nr:hypothetical protein [Austropuccinia psidii MF-1]
MFHNDPGKFFSDRKNVPYSPSFLTGKGGKWIESYLSNSNKEGPSYLFNNWKLFETQLFTLFGDTNGLRKSEQELDNIKMKESGHVSLYFAYFRSLMSRIGDLVSREYNNVYRKVLESKLLDQLDSHPGNVDSLQELLDITLELDTSNDLATAVSSVSLVGELKTPSLPSSVHIPPIIPFQSLLPSLDEVFKEIKDVSISSINLFQGAMEIPSLSFHASLEEQWDEEEEPEEIETVLRVVPPAYYHYWNVFSKVKEEKLPPHHSCDHQIELEGSLPPVGVIYSLSPDESKTLWAYISQYVERFLLAKLLFSRRTCPFC